VNRQIVLARRPQGVPLPEDFRTIATPVPEPAEGQVLIRHTWLGLAPAARLRMSQTASYREPMAVGEVVYGQALGTVVTSRDPGVQPGETVMSASGGWQEYSVAAAGALVKADLQVAPASVWLGALGTSGLTAYVGLIDIGQARAGETVVVSAASGGVGSMVGQIAKQLGCRVVGIAGGAEKVCRLIDTLGFDAGVDYRCDGFAEHLRAACAHGVDIYFDNVGGAVRDTVWPLMNLRGRVVVCGQIAEYNDASAPGPGWMSILSKRLSVRGFIMSDHLDRQAAFQRDMLRWHREGGVRVLEDVREGFESTVPAFIAMLTGRNLGKTLVRL
jgi:NADPH-dependent curcumin reductase CurA